MLFAVIMAGGRGERFWPLSRKTRPKQLLRLLSDFTMLEETVRRLDGLVPPERIMVITNCELVDSMRKILADLPPGNIIGEPVGRDTGPCVALAAALVRSRGGEDAVMALLPADAVIHDDVSLRQVLGDAAACAAAMPESLLTIGIPPTFAATGYGYIHCGEAVPFATKTTFHAGLGFREKPDEKTAEAMLLDGHYRWNSGMFIWSVKAISRAFKLWAPELDAAEERFFQAESNGTLMEELPELYGKCAKISIDYAVMEKASPIVVADCTFDWDDAGSWTALRNHLEADSDENVVSGRFAGVDVRHCTVINDSKNHLIAALDVEDLVIVHTGDATLITSARSAQRIKLLLEEIRTQESTEDLF